MMVTEEEFNAVAMAAMNAELSSRTVTKLAGNWPRTRSELSWRDVPSVLEITT